VVGRPRKWQEKHASACSAIEGNLTLSKFLNFSFIDMFCNPPRHERNLKNLINDFICGTPELGASTTRVRQPDQGQRWRAAVSNDLAQQDDKGQTTG
jgi:hypothetical protein